MIDSKELLCSFALLRGLFVIPKMEIRIEAFARRPGELLPTLALGGSAASKLASGAAAAADAVSRRGSDPIGKPQPVRSATTRIGQSLFLHLWKGPVEAINMKIPVFKAFPPPQGRTKPRRFGV